MASVHKIAPMLWFDSQAEEAANLYVSIFPSSKIIKVARYGHEGQEIHGGKPGQVMSVTFELDGFEMTALNGGPMFKFTEAISLQVFCESQAEIDRLWGALAADPSGGQCGWTKDKFGVSWQITPRILADMLTDKDEAKANRTMKVMLKMKKLDLPALKKAYEG
jgi:predicted 3-demethylubiquinone-9 3-methyltransferase (glyoxalase superfamily)